MKENKYYVILCLILGFLTLICYKYYLNTTNKLPKIKDYNTDDELTRQMKYNFNTF